MIWQGMSRRPEIPHRDLIFVSNLGNGGVDGIVPFQVIGFGGDDRKRARFNNTVEHLAHVLVIFGGWFFGPPCFHADDDNGRFPLPQFAIERRFIWVTGFWIRAEWGKDSCSVESAFYREAFARE